MVGERIRLIELLATAEYFQKLVDPSDEDNARGKKVNECICLFVDGLKTEERQMSVEGIYEALTGQKFPT